VMSTTAIVSHCRQSDRNRRPITATVEQFT